MDAHSVFTCKHVAYITALTVDCLSHHLFIWLLVCTSETTQIKLSPYWTSLILYWPVVCHLCPFRWVFFTDSVPSLPLPIVLAVQTVCFLPLFVKVPHIKPINRDHWWKINDVSCTQNSLRKKKCAVKIPEMPWVGILVQVQTLTPAQQELQLSCENWHNIKQWPCF